MIIIREFERGIEEERLASDVGHPGGGHVKLALGWERIHESDPDWNWEDFSLGAALAVKVNTTRRMMMLCGGGVCVLRATLIAFDSANWIIRYLGRPQQQQ